MIRAGVQPSGFQTHVSGSVHGWQSVSEANDLEERDASQRTNCSGRGVARALMYFPNLMLRDFVALISHAACLAESGGGRESYADQRTVPRCMALSR